MLSSDKDRPSGNSGTGGCVVAPGRRLDRAPGQRTPVLRRRSRSAGQGRVATSSISGVSIDGGSARYAPGVTDQTALTSSPAAAASRRRSRGVKQVVQRSTSEVGKASCRERVRKYG